MKNILMFASFAALLLISGDHANAEMQRGGNGQDGGRGPVQAGQSNQNPQRRGVPDLRNNRPGGANQQARGVQRPQMRPGQVGNRSPDNPQAIMAQFDVNGDGVITPDEVPGDAQQRLAEMDTNGDGGCDLSELQLASQKQPGRGVQRQGGQGDSRAIFAQFDQNGDGMITPDEVPQNGRQRLAQMDTNRDGACDRSEMEAAMQNQPVQTGRRRGQTGPGQANVQGQRGGPGQRDGQIQSGMAAFNGPRRPGGAGQARGARGGNRR